MRRTLLLLITSLVVWGRSFSQDIPYVVLISFDGFRFDYVEKFDAPSFKALAKKGTRAEALIPSFPSKTFPNHYTLVTGLYPGHHGLVDNNFYDPERTEVYEMKNRQIVGILADDEVRQERRDKIRGDIPCLSVEFHFRPTVFDR